ncbi:hypothetical protein FNW02_12075 [Komarekiella sp. 'clone 1']|uniref:Uncharacterized protein n=1 Tax=Komarekiella delphini-convector SJRDD-AB1 TaxID=2593771 RepID=A0AA40SWS7_9NOST|nr:hypothetical protein [Komarekiella delphini-convector]MBD6616550.1 hypothetical protein [Komarekiella delphini-convector SJRDD-AB1]
MNPPEEYINNFQDQYQDINKSNNNSNVPAINSLDKVRDILVGNQMREVEKKFTRLEERLVKESANVRDEAKKRLDALETYIKKEIESLTEQLRIEQLERDAIVKILAEEQKSVASSLEKKVTQFNEQTTNSQRDLREQILNQSKNLQDEIRQKYEEILVLLEREAKELRRDQTDRSHLAALFSELAIRLNYDTKS